ncbi:putative Eukaryotic translation initiation factor 3 subunit A [Hibiscus syriacus]|uniref:Eukaryotic translation initiation factor 3 subunit A n=1 Tax=Hibiscus syriacus TaxID=106335 RepID=A0A6A3B3R0_HIBSY|nr:putative Eukaryotic translation initiation factor 3 subunit A [Hibiscus syriacus]
MLLQLPLAQQSLSQKQQRKLFEQLLDGSLMLLNVCGAVRDALSQTKECTQDLQPILRRRRGVEGLANEVSKNLTSSKAVRKSICKVLKNLKHMENQLSKDSETGSVISTLKQVEAVTINVLESLLSFISGPEAESKSSPCMKHVENVQKKLENSEMCIQDLDKGLECLFRRLIKARVTVINILNC